MVVGLGVFGCRCVPRLLLGPLLPTWSLRWPLQPVYLYQLLVLSLRLW